VVDSHILSDLSCQSIRLANQRRDTLQTRDFILLQPGCKALWRVDLVGRNDKPNVHTTLPEGLAKIDPTECGPPAPPGVEYKRTLT